MAYMVLKTEPNNLIEIVMKRRTAVRLYFSPYKTYKV